MKNPNFSVGYGNPGLHQSFSQGIRAPKRDFNRIGTLNFDISFTNRIKITQLSYSYLVYLK